MGKRKIEIKEIKDDRQKRSVTFTKRRDGLFKKAETACQKFGGLQIGILVFSPAGKPFTFTNSSSSSSSISVDEIIDTYYYMSSSSSSSTTTSSAVVMGKRRSRSDDDVQVIETEKKKKQKTMNAVVTTTPPCSSITVEVEEEEKLDEGFHSKNLDSDQTHDHDQQELRNEFFFMGGYGENAGIIVTEEEEMRMESSQFLVEGESSHNWAPPDVDQFQEIVNVEDDDDFETTMGLLPPSHTSTTSSFCDLLSASDTNDEEEDYGYTLEEWEQIFSTSPNTSDMNEQVPADDNWPTQEFLQHLCS